VTPADRRVAVVQAALAVVGMGAHDPEAYLDLVGPGESAEVRRAMLTLSGCALVAAGVLRRAGLEAPELAPPYRIGSAVSRLVAVAKRCGAWRTQGLPQLGDVVLVREPEHVFVVVEAPSREGAASASLVAVDGGQIWEAQQIVMQREHTWRLSSTWRDVRPGLWRQVVGWIDVGALPIASQAERDEVEVYG